MRWSLALLLAPVCSGCVFRVALDRLPTWWSDAPVSPDASAPEEWTAPSETRLGLEPIVGTNHEDELAAGELEPLPGVEDGHPREEEPVRFLDPEAAPEIGAVRVEEAVEAKELEEAIRAAPPESPKPRPPSRPYHRLFGRPVVDIHRRSFGVLDDLAIDLESGRVAYAVVAPYGARPDTPLLVLPRNLLVWDQRGDRFVSRFTRRELARVSDLRARRVGAALEIRRPEPRPLNASGGAPELRELFQEQVPQTLSGTVTEVVQEPAAEEGAPAALVLKLREDNNHHHRVLLGPVPFVSAHAPEAQQRVEVEAVQTRDASGLLWVASVLTVEEASVRLRRPTGEPFWGGSAEPVPAASPVKGDPPRHLSALGFTGADLRTADDRIVTAVDVVADRNGASITLNWRRRDQGPGDERVLPWDVLRLTEEGALMVDLDLEGLVRASL